MRNSTLVLAMIVGGLPLSVMADLSRGGIRHFKPLLSIAPGKIVNGFTGAYSRSVNGVPRRAFRRSQSLASKSYERRGDRQNQRGNVRSADTLYTLAIKAEIRRRGTFVNAVTVRILKKAARMFVRHGQHAKARRLRNTARQVASRIGRRSPRRIGRRPTGRIGQNGSNSIYGVLRRVGGLLRKADSAFDKCGRGVITDRRIFSMLAHKKGQSGQTQGKRYERQGDRARRAGKLQQALVFYQRAAVIERQRCGTTVNELTARIFRKSAAIYVKQGKHKKARRTLNIARKMERRVGVTASNGRRVRNRTLVSSRNSESLGDKATRSGNYVRAAGHYINALKRTKRRHGTWNTPTAARIYRKAGRMYTRWGKHRNARIMLREARNIERRLRR